MNTNDLQIIAKNLAALNQHMLSSDKMIFYGLFAIAAWLIALTIAVLIVRARQTPLLYASPLTKPATLRRMRNWYLRQW